MDKDFLLFLPARYSPATFLNPFSDAPYMFPQCTQGSRVAMGTGTKPGSTVSMTDVSDWAEKLGR